MGAIFTIPDNQSSAQHNAANIQGVAANAAAAANNNDSVSGQNADANTIQSNDIGDKSNPNINKAILSNRMSNMKSMMVSAAKTGMSAAKTGLSAAAKTGTSVANKTGASASAAASKFADIAVNKTMVKQETDPTKTYGNVNFISFYMTIFARLAYMDSHVFLLNYSKIFGHIVIPDIMTAINNQSKSPDTTLLDDKSMFKLVPGEKKFDLDTYTSDTGQVHLQFLPLAGKINAAIGESRTDTESNCQILFAPAEANLNLMFISIGTSNYGGIYIIADKRMPNIINVVFRGTYSAKSAQSYLKPRFYATGVGVEKSDTEIFTKEMYLDGVLKILAENIHCIVNSIGFIGNKLRDVTNFSGKIHILTTGHSLGGALCTIFSYLWVAHIKTQLSDSEKRVIDNIDENITCISIGSPRVFGSSLANLFCCLTNNLPLDQKTKACKITDRN